VAVVAAADLASETLVDGEIRAAWLVVAMMGNGGCGGDFGQFGRADACFPKLLPLLLVQGEVVVAG
jgi:hypothetical protein